MWGRQPFFIRPMCVSDPHDSITEDPQSGNPLLDDLYDEPESVFAELEVLADPLQIGMCTHAGSLLQCTHTTQPRSFEQHCSYWSGRKPLISCGADGRQTHHPNPNTTVNRTECELDQ